MLIVKPKGVLKSFLLAGLALTLVLGAGIGSVQAQAPLFQRTAEGMIRPFKLKGLPLGEFVRAYAELTQASISLGVDSSDGELTGKISMGFPVPIPLAELTELFHQALLDNGYTVVDGPAQSGWIIMRQRDARDALIPIHESGQVPATYRVVTAVHRLAHIPAEDASRVLRSFTPASARIIPVSHSEVWITADGNTIRKTLEVLRMIDIPAAARVASEPYRSRSCPGKEERIEKLVVEHLEISGNQPTQGAFTSSNGPPRPYYDFKPSNNSSPRRGGK